MPIKSLKKFLITTTCTTIIAVSLISISISYYLIDRYTDKFFDILLVETAKKIRVFIRVDLQPAQIHDIQEQLSLCATDYDKENKIYKPCELNSDYAQLQSWARKFTNQYETDSIFQVWQIKPKKLLIHSLYAPNEQFADFIPGFTDTVYKKQQLRVFTQINPELNIIIQTAQNNEMRDYLARLVIKDYIWPIAAVLPILLLLILFAIKVAIESISHVSEAISKRDPKNLDHLKIKYTPQEIKPLIHVINRLFDRIKKSFAREQRFNSDAAHELKTPLAGIKTQAEVAKNNIAQLLTQSKLSTSTSETIANLSHNLESIIQGVNRSDHIISQLLVLSRLSPEQPLTEVAACNLEQITREIIVDLMSKANDKNIEVSLNIESKKNKNLNIVQGNKILLNILIKNLIDNAIKYIPANSIIEVTINNINKHNISLTVADNGPGIPDHLKQRIFDRFFREPGTDAEGSGLGLSIVKMIANLHNAKIYIRDNDKYGHGLVFKILFRI